MLSNIDEDNNHKSSPLEEEISKEWYRIYTRFQEDTNNMILKAGGYKNLEIQFIEVGGESKNIDLSKLLLVFKNSF